MVKSLNSKVDLVIKGTYHNWIVEYGDIMIGNAGFEFYNSRNVRKCVQINWDNIECVTAIVLFKGKWIPRFCIYTKDKITYNFSVKKPKKVLKIISHYISSDNMYRSLGFFKSIKQKFTSKNQ